MVGAFFGKSQCVLGLWWCAVIVGVIVLSAIPASTMPLGTDGARTNTVVEGVWELTPTAIAFTNVPVGETYTQVVRIANVGVDTLQIRKIIASQPEFQISGILLPVVVAHGTSELFTISYRASAQARTMAQIRVFTSLDETPLVLDVRASTGASQTEITASEASVDFEDVAVGGSARREVFLTNSGNREVNISGINVTGTGFSVAGAGTVNLSPGQQVRLDINFAPKNAGRQSGSLSVSSGEGTSLLEIPLTALGAPSSQSTVRLNWENSPVGVAGYIIYRATEPSGPYTRITSAVTASEYIDTGLAAGHTYYYVITSLDADQAESEYSQPISATVPAV